MEKLYCENCGEIIDDWEAPEGFKVYGKRLCRRCYLDEMLDYTEPKPKLWDVFVGDKIVYSRMPGELEQVKNYCEKHGVENPTIKEHKEVKMPKEERVAYGYALRILETAIEEKGGRVTATDKDNWWRCPRHENVKLFGKAVAMGALDGELEELYGAAMTMINSDAGSFDSPVTIDDRMDIMLAYQKFGCATVSVGEATEILGVSKGRISQMLTDGELIGLKVRGKWRICMKSLEK